MEAVRDIDLCRSWQERKTNSDRIEQSFERFTISADRDKKKGRKREEKEREKGTQQGQTRSCF